MYRNLLNCPEYIWLINMKKIAWKITYVMMLSVKCIYIYVKLLWAVNYWAWVIQDAHRVWKAGN